MLFCRGLADRLRNDIFFSPVQSYDAILKSTDQLTFCEERKIPPDLEVWTCPMYRCIGSSFLYLLFSNLVLTYEKSVTLFNEKSMSYECFQ